MRRLKQSPAYEPKRETCKLATQRNRLSHSFSWDVGPHLHTVADVAARALTWYGRSHGPAHADAFRASYCRGIARNALQSRARVRRCAIVTRARTTRRHEP